MISNKKGVLILIFTKLIHLFFYRVYTHFFKAYTSVFLKLGSSLYIYFFKEPQNAGPLSCILYYYSSIQDASDGFFWNFNTFLISASEI